MATQFTSFDGQLTKDQLKAFMENGREARLKAREEFLKANPSFYPCAVSGCEGLVSPLYTRGYTEDGKPIGFCPRTSIHARLMPELFSAPAVARRARRSTPSDWAVKPQPGATKAK